MTTNPKDQMITVDIDTTHPLSPTAIVTIKNNNGDDTEIYVYRSTSRDNTINVDITGDFTTGTPSLRVNLNDVEYIYDSTRTDA